MQGRISSETQPSENFLVSEQDVKMSVSIRHCGVKMRSNKKRMLSRADKELKKGQIGLVKMYDNQLFKLFIEFIIQLI